MPPSDVEFDSGADRVRGYLASADLPGPHPGLIVVPDVHGLGDHYRDVARRFAREGFATLAVDIYSREGAPTLADPGAVGRWIRALPDERVLGDLEAALTYLAAIPHVAGAPVAITGFCMGGQYALLAACRDARLAACVPWYGMLRYQGYDDCNPASPLDRAAALHCPLLGLYGENDSLIPLADVEELRRRLAGAGKDFEIHTYRGAGHAFFNDTRPAAHRRDAAQHAWRRAIAFLHARLDPKSAATD